MTTPPTFHLDPQAGPMLFADCPFCLAPLPLDAATGTMDCADCGIRLELKDDPAPVAPAARRVLAPAA
jgi:uncharacterized Zn finger protein (UPF0148 family)